MKKQKKILTPIILSCAMIVTASSLSNCSSPAPAKATGDYQTADVGKVNKVVPGVILSQRIVNVYNKSLMQREEIATNNETNENVTRTQGYEYVIKLDSGSIISVVQTEDLHLVPKQHILVIYGSSTRVVPDEGSEE